MGSHFKLEFTSVISPDPLVSQPSQISSPLWWAASSLVPEVPLRHAPSLSAVDRELAEALDDAALPLPTEHHLHRVNHAHLKDTFGLGGFHSGLIEENGLSV